MSIFKAYGHLLTEGTHGGVTGETNEEYQIRREAEFRAKRALRKAANEMLHELSENDEAYLEEVMGVCEIKGSVYESIRDQLNRLVVDMKAVNDGTSEDIDDPNKTFRKYKAILTFVINQTDGIHAANKNKIIDTIALSSTPLQLHDNLLHMKMGAYGFDYRSRKKQ